MKSSNDLMAYHRYMTQIAILLGADKATAATEMQDVIDFEVSLANVSTQTATQAISYSKPISFVGVDV